MKWVSTWLARGVLAAGFLVPSGGISDSTVLPAERAFEAIQSQDYRPLFELAGRRLDEYFRSLQEEKFLDEIFSLSGKWKAVTRGEESYERFVRKAFEKHLVNPAQLGGLLDRIREDFAFLAQSWDNRLLVVVYEDFGPGRPELTFARLRSDYRGMAAGLAPEVVRDLGLNLVSWVGSETAAVLAVSALTSTGVLGTSVAAGAAGSGWTFGVSLLVGVIAGLAIDAVVGGAYEDAARMEIRRHLNAFRNQMIDEVYRSLGAAVAAHRRLQEKCVRKLFRQGGSDDRVARGP